MVAVRGGARRVVHPSLGIWVRHANLGFEPIRVAEKEAEDVAEVSDEAVRCSALEQALADLVEGVERRCFESEMVEPASPEHGHLAEVLVVAGDLEDVELSSRTDAHHCEPEAVSLLEGLGGRFEDGAVELDEPVGIGREDRDVVDSAKEHAEHSRAA